MYLVCGPYTKLQPFLWKILQNLQKFLFFIRSTASSSFDLILRFKIGHKRLKNKLQAPGALQKNYLIAYTGCHVKKMIDHKKTAWMHMELRPILKEKQDFNVCFFKNILRKIESLKYWLTVEITLWLSL